MKILHLSPLKEIVHLSLFPKVSALVRPMMTMMMSGGGDDDDGDSDDDHGGAMMMVMT